MVENITIMHKAHNYKKNEVHDWILSSIAHFEAWHLQDLQLPVANMYSPC